MNYRRIELIFLIIFVCINIYLVSIWYDANKEKAVTKSTAEKDIVEILVEDGIKYNFKLSTDHTKGSYISGEVTDLFVDKSSLNDQKIHNNQGILVSNFNNPIKINKNKEIQDINQLKSNPKIIHYGNDYHYLKEASQSNKVVCYSQRFDKLPIFDESAETIFLKEKNKNHQEEIIGYKQQHIHNIQKMRSDKKLISQKDALITLYNNNKLENTTKINWIKLGYTKIYNDDKTNIYVPTWIVNLINDNDVEQIEKVNAITNKIMNNSLSVD